MRKAAAEVSVGTYSAWENTATLRVLGGARGAWAPTRGGEGRGILCLYAHSLFEFNFLKIMREAFIYVDV